MIELSPKDSHPDSWRGFGAYTCKKKARPLTSGLAFYLLDYLMNELLLEPFSCSPETDQTAAQQQHGGGFGNGSRSIVVFEP